jgi:hypothetical protein
LQSSILHSAITAHHRGGSSSPTIASLLHSSPGVPAPGLSSVAPPPVMVSSSLKNLVTSAIGAAGTEDTPKPPSTSPAAGELSHHLCTLCVSQREDCDHADCDPTLLFPMRTVSCQSARELLWVHAGKTTVVSCSWCVVHVLLKCVPSACCLSVTCIFRCASV